MIIFVWEKEKDILVNYSGEAERAEMWNLVILSNFIIKDMSNYNLKDNWAGRNQWIWHCADFLKETYWWTKIYNIRLIILRTKVLDDTCYILAKFYVVFLLTPRFLIQKFVGRTVWQNYGNQRVFPTGHLCLVGLIFVSQCLSLSLFEREKKKTAINQIGFTHE